MLTKFWQQPPNLVIQILAIIYHLLCVEGLEYRGMSLPIGASKFKIEWTLEVGFCHCQKEISQHLDSITIVAPWISRKDICLRLSS